MDDDDPTALRMGLVTDLKRRGAVVTDTVEHALREVPRHLFVPEVDYERAYLDDSVVVKCDENGQALASASQPTIVATMLEQLQVSRGHRVLEIGTGTGYNSALLAALTGPEGTVVSVELEPDLAARAAAVLANVCGMRIQVVTGDGRDGYSAGSPYDRVIVTSGARAIAGPWKEQLIDDGRLVVPIVDESGAGSIGTFDKVNGELVCRAQIPCGFLL